MKKNLKNIKHCAEPSLAKWYKDRKETTTNTQKTTQMHTECDNCNEACNIIDMSTQKIQKQQTS